MSNTRKVFRVGVPIGLSLNIFNILNQYKKSEVSLYNKFSNKHYVSFKILDDLSLILYFLADHIVFLCRLGFIKNEKVQSKADYISNLFWLLESIFCILHNTVELLLIQTNIQESVSLYKKVKLL